MESLSNIILFVCAAFAAGIWLAGLYSWNIPVVTALAVVLLLLAVWRVKHGSQQSIWPVIGLFFIAGIIYYSHDIVVRSDNIGHYIGHEIDLAGTVAAVPEITSIDEQSQYVRYIVNIEKIKPKHRRSFRRSFMQASGKVRITAMYKGAPDKLAAYGDKVVASGTVMALHGYNNPGRIDMTAALKRQNITARMSIQGHDIKVRQAVDNANWQVVLASWQQSVIAGFQKVMPVNDAAILTAVLFGGYQGINKNVIQDFATTGLIHILSVSGAHMALVAGLIRWLGNWLGLNSLTTLLIAAVTIILYAAISGFTPPVIRSAIMGVISLLAVVFGREAYAPAALAATALAMLIYQPLMLYDISFQLSVGATAGLVFLYPQTLQRLSWLPAWLAGPLAVTLSAQLGVLPFIAWYFNSFPLISFAANIIVLPAVELVILLGLAGVVVYSIASSFGNIIFVISSLLIGLVTTLTAVLASLPYSSVYIPTVGLAGGAGYYILLAWVYGWRPFGLPGPGQLIRKSPRCCTLAVLFVAAAMFTYSLVPGPLTVHFIDVGQGDATLIITPRGQAVLIDTGGSSNFDIGERVVAPYLKHYGVTAVEYLILTHGHQDHTGGAAGVADQIGVNKVIVAKEKYSQPVQALLRSKPAVTVIPAYTGQSFCLDDVLFTVEQAVGEHTVSRNAAASNEVSSVIRVSYGQHSFLITGDLEAEGETTLVSQGLLPCTVLKVGHHGSRTSSSKPFLEAASPQYAVISAGYGNKFGHPHTETLQRFAEINTKIYRTDKQGAIVFKSDGKNITVDTFSDSAAVNK